MAFALKWLVFTFLCFVSSAIYAAELLHAIKASDTVDSRQTGSMCGILEMRPSRLICAGSRHLDEPQGKLGLEALAKINDKSLNISQKLLSNGIDKAFMDSLFSENNFQSASGLISLNAHFGKTKVSYTPFHVIGAFKLINPSLPEIHASAAIESVFKISQLFYWDDLFITHSLLVNAEPYYYNREFKSIDVDILEASTLKKPKDIIKSTDTKGADLDLGMTFVSKKSWIPSVSVNFENLAQDKVECPKCDLALMDLSNYFETSAEVSASISVLHPYGASVIGGFLPFRGIFKRAEQLLAGGSYAYVIRLLKIYGYATPMSRGFGFKFSSDLYNLSIQYTDEKQENLLQIDREQHVYLFTEFAI